MRRKFFEVKKGIFVVADNMLKGGCPKGAVNV